MYDVLIIINNEMNQSLKQYVALEDKLKLLRTDANTKQDFIYRIISLNLQIKKYNDKINYFIDNKIRLYA